ncbi:MAG TPA: hypothetical protein VGN01_12815 [Acidobacteriaceae bacterium]
MSKLEQKFTRTQRTHTFIESISLAKRPEPETTPAAPPQPPTQVPVRHVSPAPSEIEPPPPAIEVLEGLREDWLSRAATPEPETEAAPQPAGKRKQRRKSQTTLADRMSFVESLKASIRRRLASLKEARNLRTRQERSTLVVAGAILAGIAILILIGALVYSATVASIFSPGSLFEKAQSDASSALAASSTPIAGQTTQASALSKPADPASAQPASAPITITSSTDASPILQFDVPRLNSIPPVASGGADGGPLAHPEQTAAAVNHAFGAAAAPPLSAAAPAPAAASIRATDAARPSAPAHAPAAADAHAAAYLSLVHAAEGSLAHNDLQSAYQSAVQAKALEPQSLPALELMQAILARAGNPHDAEVAAHDAIARGGQAVFELQHFHAAPAALHPARIVITATTLQFVPEGPCTTGEFTVPLASITTVQTRQTGSGIPVLTLRFGGGNAHGELSFRDASSQFRNANPAQLSSRLSPAQETALFTAIRNVLLAPKGGA